MKVHLAWGGVVAAGVLLAQPGQAQERRPAGGTVEQRLDRLEAALGKLLEESKATRAQLDEALPILRRMSKLMEPAEQQVRAQAAADPEPPDSLPGRESAAIGLLRSLTTAQEQFKQQVLVDQDGDGMGEYGWLGELAGTDGCRVSGMRCAASPFIAPVLGVKDTDGRAQRHGYYFRLFLPTADGPARAESRSVDPRGIEAEADCQEVRWACYAWPVNRGVDGNRSFFASHTGEIYATSGDAKPYSGIVLVPDATAAFDRSSRQAANLDAGVGLAAAGLRAYDGNTWVPAGN